MKMESVSVLHFSPTGSTSDIAMYLGCKLSERVVEFDLSKQVLEGIDVGEKSLAVVAVPVYGGRVPRRAVEALRFVSGNGAACVSVAVFGNRAVDDALVELNDVLTEQGFRVMASGEFVAQHSLVAEVGAGRPDEGDFAALGDFADGILKRVAAGDFSQVKDVPGNRDYASQAVAPAAVTPMVLDSCLNCGMCARSCPVSAIPVGNCKETDAGKCMLCMRCVKTCPTRSRVLPAPFKEAVSARLQAHRARREPRVYL